MRRRSRYTGRYTFTGEVGRYTGDGEVGRYTGDGGLNSGDGERERDRSTGEAERARVVLTGVVDLDRDEDMRFENCLLLMRWYVPDELCATHGVKVVHTVRGARQVTHPNTNTTP